MATLHPTQIGYVAPSSTNTSALYFGRIISPEGTNDGVGFGPNARPDYLQKAIITLMKKTGTTYTQVGTISLNASDIVTAQIFNSNVPANIELTLREVRVCDNGTEKSMMILASAPYATP